MTSIICSSLPRFTAHFFGCSTENQENNNSVKATATLVALAVTTLFFIPTFLRRFRPDPVRNLWRKGFDRDLSLDQHLREFERIGRQIARGYPLRVRDREGVMHTFNRHEGTISYDNSAVGLVQVDDERAVEIFLEILMRNHIGDADLAPRDRETTEHKLRCVTRDVLDSTHIPLYIAMDVLSSEFASLRDRNQVLAGLAPRICVLGARTLSFTAENHITLEADIVLQPLNLDQVQQFRALVGAKVRSIFNTLASVPRRTGTLRATLRATFRLREEALGIKITELRNSRVY